MSIWSDVWLGSGGSGSSGTKSSGVLNFGSEDHYAEVLVAETSVTAQSVVLAMLSSEDLLVQDVGVDCIEVVPGVGYRLAGIAPQGASGSYTVPTIIF